MNTFLRIFGTDETAEEQGKKIACGKNGKGESVYLMIARARNKKHREFLRTGLSQEEKAMLDEFTTYDPEIAPVLAKIYGNCLLKGWINMLDENNKSVKFTVKKAVEELEKFKELRTFVSGYATDSDNYKIQLEDEIVKKSQDLSDGN